MAGVMRGTLHRISAGALRNRGLVKTSGRGPTCSAKITAAGRDYLREVDGPDPPIPRQANASSHLRAQAEAWELAERLRCYCDALAEAHGDSPRTAGWIAWAREYARLDPLVAPQVMPEPPEETPEALQQHLPNGWSVYGSEHGYRPRRYSSFG